MKNLVPARIYLTVNDALPDLARHVLDGDELGSRKGERVLERLHQQITLTEPWDRYPRLGLRKASLPAQIAETMWILAGRNDVEWLSYYLPRAAEFSDDGETWRGGYGPRLRRFGAPLAEGILHLDQLDAVVRELRAHPTSRRAVLSIYDPLMDTRRENEEPWKDVPCLAGETPLLSPEGDLPISEVAEKFTSGEVSRWPVYAVNPETREMELQWATRVWQSAVKPTIKLNFDDGSDLRLTPDHRLYIKRRVPSGKKYGSTWSVEEILAGDLQPGDRVLATRRFSDAKGYETHKRRLDKNTAWSNLRDTHRAYAEMLYGPIPDDFDVHHVNEVKTDNRAENLQVLPHGEHASLNMAGDRNPMRRLTPEQHLARAVKQSESLKANWATQSEERRERQREIMREVASAPDNHVVVSVEDGGAVPVYDFTVPGFHTALVGTGVVAHNCNDFISFQSRLGKLHAHVFVRSNDLMWGWSGINAFEWSVLQEVIAGILGIEVGTLTFSISSLHAYDRHWSKLGRIAEAYPAPEEHLDPLDAFDAPRLTKDSMRPRSVEELDVEISEWFVYERKIRNAGSFDEAWAAAHSSANSGLFTAFLQVIAAARFGRADDLTSRTLRESLKASPRAPFAVDEEREEFHTKQGPVLTKTVPPAPGREILQRIPSRLSLAETVEGLAAEITTLHNTKHAAYGDSWKRRGETLGILANIARKVDRLGKTDEHETALDTAVDLLVYLVKMGTWLYDQEDGGSRSDGTEESNARIREALRQAREDGRPYPAEFLAEDLNRSILSEAWGKVHPWIRPLDKAGVVDVMSGRAARHVLGIWRAEA